MNLRLPKHFKRDAVEFPAGAAGANVLITLPEDPGLWAVVVAMRFSVTTDATVAVRGVNIQLQQPPKPAKFLATWSGQPAGVANVYVLALHGMQILPGAAATDCYAPLGYNASEGAMNLNLIVTNRQAGDVINAGYVEFYRIPFKDLPLFL